GTPAQVPRTVQQPRIQRRWGHDRVDSGHHGGDGSVVHDRPHPDPLAYKDRTGAARGLGTPHHSAARRGGRATARSHGVGGHRCTHSTGDHGGGPHPAERLQQSEPTDRVGIRGRVARRVPQLLGNTDRWTRARSTAGTTQFHPGTECLQRRVTPGRHYPGAGVAATTRPVRRSRLNTITRVEGHHSYRHPSARGTDSPSERGEHLMTSSPARFALRRFEVTAPVSGPPVLLIHGFGSDGYADWVEPGWPTSLTSAGRTVLVPDMP